MKQDHLIAYVSPRIGDMEFVRLFGFLGDYNRKVPDLVKIASCKLPTRVGKFLDSVSPTNLCRAVSSSLLLIFKYRRLFNLIQ